jgi:hypothetical protein
VSRGQCNIISSTVHCLKRPLRRPRSRWENNIKLDLIEIRLDDKDWVHLAQNRDNEGFVNTVMNFRIP